jgi:hypothetical protein
LEITISRPYVNQDSLKLTTVMGRIFNIYFEYQASVEHAVVSVRPTPFFTEYTITQCNQELLTLLPGTKIITRGDGLLTFQNSGPENSTALMEAIIRAVSNHIHAPEV